MSYMSSGSRIKKEEESCLKIQLLKHLEKAM